MSKIFKKQQGPINYFPIINPHYQAIVTNEREYSYAQLNDHILKISEQLCLKGVKPSFRVAIYGMNSPMYIMILWALWKVQAVAVPISFRFPFKLVKEIIKNLGVSLIVCESEQWDALNAIDINIEVIDLNSWNFFDECQSPAHRISSGIKDNIANELGCNALNINQEAVVILTSGSTAEGKYVSLSLGNLFFNAWGANENMPLEPGDRWLLSLPLFHVGGLGILFRCFLSGATVAIPGRNQSLVEAIPYYNISHISLVSTQLLGLIKSPEFLNKSEKGSQIAQCLKALLVGGSAIPINLLKKALALKLPVYTTYGLTEMASQVTTTPKNEKKEKLFTSGKILKYREIKIENEEILVKGKTLFLGYIKSSKRFNPFDSQGWFKTGDLGYLDKDGYLKVLGRKDNMFISGGENIMPEEIEKVLNQLPGIQDSVVVPRKDESFGFRPVAFLKISKKAKISKEFIIQQLEKQLPRFKIPELFLKWPENLLPESMKIKRADFLDLLKYSGSISEI